MIELLMAMTILSVGLLAVMAAFNSGALALQRANRIGTAATLAEKQMELYRALRYDEIALKTSEIATVDNPYTCDKALGAACPNTTTALVGGSACTGAPVPDQCDPIRPVTGPDGRSYRVDTYIVMEQPLNAAGQAVGRQVKRVTVVVRDGGATSKSLARVASTFDSSTG
jgi:hypothetical protein